MKKITKDPQTIELLRNIPNLIPVYGDYKDDWLIKIFDRKIYTCINKLSPNRREFYKVLFISGKGTSIYTIGTNSYYIDQPSLLFVHPNDIISWKNLSEDNEGFYCLFKKEIFKDYPELKQFIEKFNVFTNKDCNVIGIADDDIDLINSCFANMKHEMDSVQALNIDVILAWLRIIILEAIRSSVFIQPYATSKEFQYLHQFFNLLEQETANINYDVPIRIKTVKEFAANLGIHPNYLNRLVKKETGKSVSLHITHRLLEEAKTLLLRTKWSFHQIAYSLGFDDQSNFTAFFKRNTHITPSQFRNNK
ncbi:helix-turn-helix domain-containing protein [Chryseobacterium sp. T20]|uniref:helix-turn-helix domain-containing protein n=1 Tax=Chryseobacterium sp. T20 TaxID=3395375 RepID=UPI0039BC7608